MLVLLGFRPLSFELDHLIIAGTYDVNEYAVSNDWTDAWGDNHKDVYKYRVRGSFDIAFRSEREYDQFIEAFNNYTNGNDAEYSAATLWVNNKNTTKQSAYSFSISPVMYKLRDGKKTMMRMTVTVEEQ